MSAQLRDALVEAGVTAEINLGNDDQLVIDFGEGHGAIVVGYRGDDTDVLEWATFDGALNVDPERSGTAYPVAAGVAVIARLAGDMDPRKVEDTR